MRANDRQVGGEHYKGAPLEHWDMVALILGGRYLEGCITKYLSRYRNKNGRQDLEKSLHYLDKLIEQAESRVSPPLSEVDARPTKSPRDLIMIQYCEGYQLNELETTAMLMIVDWRSVEDLRSMKIFLGEVIRRAEK